MDSHNKRKQEQLELSSTVDVEAGVSAGWEDIHFLHRCLPEVNRDEIDLSVDFCGERFDHPLVLSALTGGYSEAARINQTLGKVAEHYSMVMTGRVEIAEFTTGFAPGVFPLTEVLQMPFMWNGSLKGSIVANDLLRKGYLDKTLTNDVKVISLNLTEPLKIWTTKPARSMADLKGLQLRVAGGLDAKTIEALGATPIMMPLPEVYQALEKGVVDGAISGFSTGMAFKFHEAAKYVIDMPASIAVHMHMMNKKLWDSLPQNTQQILNQIFRENEIHWSETIDILE